MIKAMQELIFEHSDYRNDSLATWEFANEMRPGDIVFAKKGRNTIIGNNEFFLYYTYITNPKSKYGSENPIQFGTCRLSINVKNKLTGTYWTNRRTIGDIELKKVLKQKR